MKKIFLSICLLFSVVMAAVYADTVQDNNYINISIEEFRTFRSSYTNKRIKFSNVCIFDIYENSMSIYGGSAWDMDFVGIKHNLSNASVRDIKTKMNSRWDVYVYYTKTGLFRDIDVVQLEGLYIR